MQLSHASLIAFSDNFWPARSRFLSLTHPKKVLADSHPWAQPSSSNSRLLVAYRVRVETSTVCFPARTSKIQGGLPQSVFLVLKWNCWDQNAQVQPAKELRLQATLTIVFSSSLWFYRCCFCGSSVDSASLTFRSLNKVGDTVGVSPAYLEPLRTNPIQFHDPRYSIWYQTTRYDWSLNW